ncbi:MAG: pyridoxal 5'-phosphate synthase glutaminase subunit PdxT [Bdellovibrionales bacterium]|nr:pyridoxal 5'-phosphate synthase glutaminase subunit PdxT [Bdellovibrionales bacterium]
MNTREGHSAVDNPSVGIVPLVGILALQGCVTPHIEHFKKVGARCRSVRSEAELSDLDGLVLPGGESTTMLRLLKVNKLFDPLREFVSKKPTWGICAGAILLAEEVKNPEQDSLRIVPIRAERNFYGSQLDSFKAEIDISGIDHKVSVDFIRAPRILPLNDSVTVLARHEDAAVMVRFNNLLCSSFHTELGADSSLHGLFVRECLV